MNRTSPIANWRFDCQQHDRPKSNNLRILHFAYGTHSELHLPTSFHTPTSITSSRALRRIVLNVAIATDNLLQKQTYTRKNFKQAQSNVVPLPATKAQGEWRYSATNS
jgi:hypothetical protein